MSSGSVRVGMVAAAVMSLTVNLARADQPAPAPPAPEPAPEWLAPARASVAPPMSSGGSWRSWAVVGLVAGLGGGALWMRRKRTVLGAATNVSGRLRVLDSVRIGPQAQLVTASVGGRTVLLGVTSNSVRGLAWIREEPGAATGDETVTVAPMGSTMREPARESLREPAREPMRESFRESLRESLREPLRDPMREPTFTPPRPNPPRPAEAAGDPAFGAVFRQWMPTIPATPEARPGRAARTATRPIDDPPAALLAAEETRDLVQPMRGRRPPAPPPPPEPRPRSPRDSRAPQEDPADVEGQVSGLGRRPRRRA